MLAGVNHVSLNTSEITLENPLDPAIANGNNSQWKPDLGPGYLAIFRRLLCWRFGAAAIARKIFISAPIMPTIKVKPCRSIFLPPG